MIKEIFHYINLHGIYAIVLYSCRFYVLSLKDHEFFNRYKNYLNFIFSTIHEAKMKISLYKTVCVLILNLIIVHITNIHSFIIPLINYEESTLARHHLLAKENISQGPLWFSMDLYLSSDRWDANMFLSILYRWNSCKIWIGTFLLLFLRESRPRNKSYALIMADSLY